MRTLGFRAALLSLMLLALILGAWHLATMSTAATSAAPSSAERMAARAQRAHQHLIRRDCSSAANAVSGASFSAGHEAEHRREPLAQRGAAAFERRRIPARGFARSFAGKA